MISGILLVFTFFLLAIGGVCGFSRGVLKEGVRTVLWLVLFACSCFFVPQIADTLPLLIAEKFDLTASDVEQLVSELLNKVEFLETEAYLVLPLSGFVRTLCVPFITILLLWLSGLASLLIYLPVAFFLKNKAEEQKLVSKLAGLVLGLAVSLFTGAVTVYPVAAIGSTVREGDSNQILSKEFSVVNSISEAYEGSLVKPVYKFTGTEFLGTALHNSMITLVVKEETYNIWAELPDILRLGSEGWQMYSEFTDKTEGTKPVKEHIHQVVELYFDLEFISEENKILILNNLKSKLGASYNGSAVSKILDWLEIQNKEQFINDIGVYADLYEELTREGILDSVLNSTGVNVIPEETGKAVISSLFELSNAEVVVPGLVNMVYTAAVPETETNLIKQENLSWNEETKEDIFEVFSLIYKIPDLLTKADTMTMEEKLNALEEIKALENNSVINRKLLTEWQEVFVVLP